ncbi:polysaccharide biosynthesis tyrosine autokinase [Bernardetia sp. ABR2-2B]|uniref:GumC family protein n=1 Tax=Bernardetia sp. ABR2-2B TaxID=3127472 RepID=UPI0030D34F25
MDIQQDVITTTSGNQNGQAKGNQASLTKPDNDAFSPKKIIYTLWRNKLFILFCIGIAVSIAWWKTYYATPIYTIGAAIQVKDNRKSSSPVALLYSKDMFGGNKRLSSEIKFIRSYPFIKRVCEKMDMRVYYYQEGNIRTTEIYPVKNASFEVMINIDADSNLRELPNYKIKYKDDKSFFLINSSEEWDNARSYQFGETISESSTTFKVLNKNLVDGIIYGFRFTNPSSLARGFLGRLSAYTDEDASLIRLNIVSSVPARAKDFITTVMQEYIAYGLEDKNLEAVRTINFIDEQLSQIRDSLFLIENKIQNFKSDNKFVVGEDAVGRNLEQYVELEETNRELILQEKYLDYLVAYIKESDNYKGVTPPAAVGVEDGITSSLIGRLVDLQIQREIFLEKGSAKNPFLVETNIEIDKVRESLLEHLNNTKLNNKIAFEDIRSRLNLLDKQMNTLPSIERKLLNINRLYSINEEIYILLLNKRMEASIAQAATREDSQILEPPFNYGAISPNAKQNYTIAILLGLLFPIALVYVRNYFRSTIETLDEVKSISSVPILGVVMHSKKKKRGNSTPLINTQPKSALAEAFRSIRSNLLFLIGRIDKTSTLMISSSISGEGKSFCSANISISMALTGKRTVLIVADMRKPQMYVPMPNEQYSKDGLSTYLIGSKSLDEVVQATSIENLDVIYSGAVPPNPAELLMGESMDELIKDLKKNYDYIIIDTPPLGLVSDALILGKYANATVYVVRQDRTPIEKLKGLERIYNEQMLHNVGIIFNDVKTQSVGVYGYGSYGGYGYYEVSDADLPWWKRIAKKIKK